MEGRTAYDHEENAYVTVPSLLRPGDPDLDKFRQFCHEGRYECDHPDCSAPALTVVGYHERRKRAGSGPVIAHFAHVGPYSHGDELPDNPDSMGSASKESLEHKEAKQILQQLAQNEGLRVQAELYTDHRRQQRPDVTIWSPDNTRTALEVQISYLSPPDYQRRNSGILRSGTYQEVQWIFGLEGIDASAILQGPLELTTQEQTASAQLTDGIFRRLGLQRQAIGDAMSREAGVATEIPIDISDVYKRYGYRSPQELWFFVEHGGKRQFTQCYSPGYRVEARFGNRERCSLPRTGRIDFQRHVGIEVVPYKARELATLRCPSLDEEMALAVEIRRLTASRGLDPTLRGSQPDQLTPEEVSWRVLQLQTVARDRWQDVVEAEIPILLAEIEAELHKREAEAELVRKLDVQDAGLNAHRFLDTSSQQPGRADTPSGDPLGRLPCVACGSPTLNFSQGVPQHGWCRSPYREMGNKRHSNLHG